MCGSLSIYDAATVSVYICLKSINSKQLSEVLDHCFVPNKVYITHVGCFHSSMRQSPLSYRYRRFSCGVVDVTHFAPQSIILFWNVKLPTYFHAPLIWQLMFSFFFFIFLEHWWYSPIWRTQKGMCYVMC